MQKKETPLNQPIDKRTTKQTEIAARRQNLSAKKQALLNKWQQKKVNGANGSQHIPQRTNNQSIPLSFAQQRLWFLEQFNAQTDVSYNIPIHINIQGALDIEALEYGLNQLLQRHEILRTRYITAEDGVPYQEIMPFTAVSLLYLDLSHLPPDKREAAAFQHRQQEGQTPFALETGPIYRIQVLRLEAEYHQLLFTIHHIAFDMWSTDVFLREIIAHYLHKTTGFLPTLPDATVQYADYTVWQQTRLTPEVMETELAFWRDHLSQAPAAINLPIDKPRPLRQTTNGDLHVFTIPAEIANKVTQWTQAEQVTLYMTLLTAFNGLLYRYTHQENIVVGTPIANRNHPDLKKYRRLLHQYFGAVYPYR
ncbi:MAG: condensation domain-containing protein [Chloroflexi bacterium]|nr:condensation domain-containing protein [Chloroflexota bacterium]